MPEDLSAALQKKLADRWWRLNNLYWIQDNHGRKTKFRPNSVQAKYYRESWWNDVILKARQHGISTFIGLMMLDQCLFKSNQACGIVDRTDPDSIKKIAKIKFAYDHLDDPDDARTAVLGKWIKDAVPLLRGNDNNLMWGNGSHVWANPSQRGSTAQWVHVSELGPIAYHFPHRAQEIRTGSLNTVHAGNKITIESTHEGGRSGLFYEMIELARRTPNPTSVLEWKFHFFGWFEHSGYAVEPPATWRCPEEQELYFASIGVPLTKAQKFWYYQKQLVQREAMRKEFPSTVEEALNAVVQGAIYGRIIEKLKAQGRVVDFVPDRTKPFVTAWDLGQSDYTAIWLIMWTGMDWAAVDFYSCRGRGATDYAVQMQMWERQYNILIQQHFLPHDAGNVAGPIRRTWRQELEDAGLKNVEVVRKTPDVWIGINQLRDLLPRFMFHATNCGKERETEAGVFMPSGLGCLEGYHIAPIRPDGNQRDEPVHDQNSHGCDALRTFAEAYRLGMIRHGGGGLIWTMGSSGSAGAQGVLTGQRQDRAVLNALHASEAGDFTKSASVW